MPSIQYTPAYAAMIALAISPAFPQAKNIKLDASLKAMNVKVENVTFKGRKAVRVTDAGAPNLTDGKRLAIVPGVEFQDGVIEVDVAGDRVPGAPETARGFTGIAFRVASDAARYECFYIRPYNGRSLDQVQRNHSAQYISMPEFGWRRLREESSKKYETYVDLAPGEWTKLKIEVRGKQARLYVNGAEQPTLIVSELKQDLPKGAVALWIDPSSLAHFSNLRITQ